MGSSFSGRLVSRVVKGARRERMRVEAGSLPSVDLDPDRLLDILNIAHGVYSPLIGFTGREDLENILRRMRLTQDTPWTIPILLDVEETPFSQGDDIALRWGGVPVAILEVEEIYSYDRKKIASMTFGTLDSSHPGVAETLSQHGRYVSGPVRVFEEPAPPGHLLTHRHYPAETRMAFRIFGWKTVVGFQTRNVPHVGHEHVQKWALTFVDGLFINPIIGKKKKGDFRDELIIRGYETLMKNYYPKGRVFLGTLHMRMRYAGPREAILHALVRKNFGCTHFIIGRDHAGVGKFYHPYAAQEIFSEFPDLGIEPVFFRSFFWCRKCMGVANEKTCPHTGEKDRIDFSGTRIREMILSGRTPPPEIIRPEVAEVILSAGNPFVG